MSEKKNRKKEKEKKERKKEEEEKQFFVRLRGTKERGVMKCQNSKEGGVT